MSSQVMTVRRQLPWHPHESPEGCGMSKLTLLRAVIARVPRGKVITYGQVAEAAGFPGGARLTVRALYGAEGLPWHRVVGSGGRISLPGEEGREQRVRLKMEGVTFRGSRVRMDLHAWTPRASRKRRSSRAKTSLADPARSPGVRIPFAADRGCPFGRSVQPPSHPRSSGARKTPEGGPAARRSGKLIAPSIPLPR